MTPPGDSVREPPGGVFLCPESSEGSTMETIEATAAGGRRAAPEGAARGRQAEVKFIRLWFTDVVGRLKSFAITRDELAIGARSRDGLRRLVGDRLQRDRGVRHDRDARPDDLPDAAARSRASAPSARMFCDIRTPDGEPYEADSRQVLRNALDRMRSLGFDSFKIGPELEFFLFRMDEQGRAAHAGRRRLLRGHHHGRRRRAAQGDRARARGAWASRSSTCTTRSAPASTRSTSATPTRCRWPTTA